jgi:uncharacterized membrane protein
MSTTWFTVIATSGAAFALKYLGHSLPAKVQEHEKMLRINLLIPVALLSALVAVQTFASKTKLLIDHRIIGLIVAAVALKAKAPLPVVVVGAAIASALLYRYQQHR